MKKELNKPNVLMLTGAGCSHPLKLPLTNGFEKLIKKSGEFFNVIQPFLKDKVNDVEHVLRTIEIYTKKDMLVWSIIDNGVNNSNSHYDFVNNQLLKYNKLAEQLSFELKQNIFDVLSNFEIEDAKLLYINLLKEVLTVLQPGGLSVFTTNYDLTFEDAFAEFSGEFISLGIEELNMGFVENKGMRRIYDDNSTWYWDTREIEYKKLHGSIDWLYKNNDVIKAGAHSIPRDPENMPILYPGFKETPTSEPFISLHNQFLNRLLDADLLIVIGYANRDPYIASLLEIAIAQNANLNCFYYEPKSLSDLPVESKTRSLAIKFQNRFFHVKQGVAIKENPLNLKEELDKKQITIKQSKKKLKNVTQDGNSIEVSNRLPG